MVGARILVLCIMYVHTCWVVNGFVLLKLYIVSPKDFKISHHLFYLSQSDHKMFSQGQKISIFGSHLVQRYRVYHSQTHTNQFLCSSKALFSKAGSVRFLTDLQRVNQIAGVTLHIFNLLNTFKV